MAYETAVAVLIGLGAGGLLGYVVHRSREKALLAELRAREREKAEELRGETEVLRRRIESELREEAARLRSTEELAAADRQRRLDDMEERLREREAAVNRQLDRFAIQEADLRTRVETVETFRADLEREKAEALRLVAERKVALERVAQVSAEDARQQLLRQVEQDTAREASDLVRRILDGARNGAEEQARRILSIALQRYAGRHTFETSTATVALPGDDMKGRIIGRDGRNIRAFEAATGVTVLVDDTPNAVVLSGFDPVRREAARLSMERLVVDGRIHPARIEEVVAGVNEEMETFILKTGEEAVYKAGLPPMNPEVVRVLGRLHFRHSFSQNVLQHSLEVAHLCGLMASELGDDPVMARRAGLLHDIGKAMSHEMEGPHAIVGADFLRKQGEGPVVVNAVASHHEEVPHENIFGILVAAADAMSASRPGSRSESMTTYLQRLHHLEQIALEYPGVEKAFAVQAGRELRVVVRPEQVGDQESVTMAREIARRVEDEMQYPGQIRITVIRETRCVEFAK
jgi:ribonuclease Y